MSETRQGSSPVRSRVWPSGGRHVWPSGGARPREAHSRGHLVFPATGVIAVESDEGTSIVPADRFAWTPAGSPHVHRAHGETDLRIVFLPPSLAERIPDRPAVFPASDLAREAMLALTGRADGDAPIPARGAADRLRRVLVDELGEAREEQLRLPTPTDDRLRALHRAVTADLSDPRSLDAHGTAIGASGRTLSRLLRSEIGMTFPEWRTQLRVYRALILLTEGLDVTQTAHACGWSHPSAFIAVFSSVIGTTPGRYRADSRVRRD